MNTRLVASRGRPVAGEGDETMVKDLLATQEVALDFDE